MAERCGWYWGSHGCDLAPGHDGPCVCEDCSEFKACEDCPPGDDLRRGQVRYLYEDGTWSEWLETLSFRVDFPRAGLFILPA